MTEAAPRDTEIRRRVEGYCRERPGLSFCSVEIREVRVIGTDTWVFPEPRDKRCPQLFLIRRDGDGGSGPGIIPYFPIRERPNRQIVSYTLGAGLCNLAEVKELFGGLFSRYCGSYAVRDLPHRRAGLSRIALWVHDCLTEDFDHQISLNRQSLPDGVSISYDFGMAFSNHYFPPFYTMELGISDASIEENRFFLLELITGYARWVGTEEEEWVRRLAQAYPGTCHEDRCRYYLRDYKARLGTRLYFGRFFEKLRNTPFEKERLEAIAEATEVDLRGLSDWESLIRTLRDRLRGPLNLRGLNLSDMDLRRADLRAADLAGASLQGADLEGADMRGADLSGVDMRGANLKGVKMDTR